MLIAISKTGNNVDDFASALEFVLVRIDMKNKSFQKKIILDADNCPGFAGKVFQLIDLEVKILLTKAVSVEEKTVLQNSGIEVISDYLNSYYSAIKTYIEKYL